ncbi:mannose-6-phosphate isomerase, class I [Arthrobacter sp. SW1]|uniref:mannose-6-phosphate isomerase, class I n=1 Tax=Arthrobacter sp. SW1 TaxID=1920889 RepID=UPI000877B1A9|nr:mannose-6-phosphate isomerase, class I [Arthrobacter sp. SW1]OFI37784.1 mannose-6-phosphate isomerase, class I [Arthrobacter sp. SW1]
MYQLENVLRPYAWGSTTAISALLGTPASGGPEAELWIGAHPDSPSLASRSGAPALPLDAVISQDPEHFLGAASVAEFGPRLPFLGKILAADKPLSLQVHPSLEQAREGFARENAAGVAPAAADRNYRDDNHKPEMIFALTPFEALCGFRPAAESRALFAQLAELVDGSGAPAGVLRAVVAELSRPDEADALRGAFSTLISGGEAVTEAVDASVAAVAGLATEPYSAALTAMAGIATEYPGDPGVLISLMLNLVSLAPGEAIYLPAGNIHAYLKGLGVEVMASSDNVLRGGLTPKHVDIPELMKTVEFASIGVPRVEPSESELGQELYLPPFREFRLQRIELAPEAEPVPLAQSGPAVVVVVSGGVLLDSPKSELRVARGGSAFIPAAENPVMVHAEAGATDNSVAFAITTGLES